MDIFTLLNVSAVFWFAFAALLVWVFKVYLEP